MLFVQQFGPNSELVRYPIFTMNKFNKMAGSMSECLIHDYTKWTDISTRNKNWMGRYEFVFNYFWTNIKSFVFETCKNLIWFGQTIKKKIPGIGLLKLLLIPIKMYSLILQSKHFSFTVHILLHTGTKTITFILPHGILAKAIRKWNEP